MALGRRRKAWLRLAVLVATGCAAATDDPPPDLVQVPHRRSEADRIVAFAREQAARGDLLGGLRAVEALLRDEADHVDAHRFRQDLLRDRGRRGLLRYEAERRLAAAPLSAAAHYLMGRLLPSGAPQRPYFERAVALDPTLFWGWVGLAASLRRSDAERSLRIYRRLWEQAPQSVLNGVNLAAFLIERGLLDDAAAVYRQLRDLDDAAGVGDLGLARTALLQADRNGAWAPLLAALQARPFDAGVRRELDGYLRLGLSRERMEQIRDVLFQAPELVDDCVRTGGAPLLARLLLALGDPGGARAVLAAAAEVEPQRRLFEDLWRQTLLAAGDVGAYLDDLRAAMPPALIDDERNEVRGLWVRLLRGPWSEVDDPLGDVDLAVGLIEALRDAGLLPAAEQVASWAQLRADQPAGAAKIRGLQDEVRRLIAFEGAVRRVLYAGYTLAEPQELEQVLAQCRRLSEEILGRDVVGQPRIYRIPLIGRLVDPFGPGLPEHFARINQHLVLGQRNGMPAEAMLLRRLAVRELAEEPAVPVPLRAKEVVGEGRSIQARTSLVVGDIAGVALVDAYIIDMDAVRDWAETLLRMRQVAAEDGNALLDDPLPAELPRLDGLDAEWRLVLQSPVADGDLQAAVLDVIRWHERAHLADTFHFLPPEWNFWRVVGLLLRNGLSATSVEADLEARAELVALAMSPHTELVLAHIAGFCGQQVDGFSPHASGFERLATRLQEELRRDGLAAAEVAVGRWHLVPPGRFRQAARRLLADLW